MSNSLSNLRNSSQSLVDSSDSVLSSLNSGKTELQDLVNSTSDYVDQASDASDAVIYTFYNKIQIKTKGRDIFLSDLLRDNRLAIILYALRGSRDSRVFLLDVLPYAKVPLPHTLCLVRTFAVFSFDLPNVDTFDPSKYRFHGVL